MKHCPDCGFESASNQDSCPLCGEEMVGNKKETPEDTGKNGVSPMSDQAYKAVGMAISERTQRIRKRKSNYQISGIVLAAAGIILVFVIPQIAFFVLLAALICLAKGFL